MTRPSTATVHDADQVRVKRCKPGKHVSILIGHQPLLIYRCSICGADTSD